MEVDVKEDSEEPKTIRLNRNWPVFDGDAVNSHLDVTLVSSDGLTIKLARVLLAAVSPMLCEAMQDIQSTTDIIIKTEASDAEIKQFHSFVTTGKVVCHSDLQASQHSLWTFGVLYNLENAIKLPVLNQAATAPDLLVGWIKDSNSDYGNFKCDAPAAELSNDDEDITYELSVQDKAWDGPIGELSDQDEISAGDMSARYEVFGEQSKEIPANDNVQLEDLSDTEDMPLRKKRKTRNATKDETDQPKDSEFFNQDEEILFQEQLEELCKNGNTQDEPVGPPYTCVCCGKNYDTLTKYKAHQKLTGPFHNNQCPVCTNVTFNTWSDHQKHVEDIHNGQFVARCKYCPEYFDSDDLRSKHSRATHPYAFSEGKVAECPHCGKCTSKFTMSEHIKTRHGDAKFPCGFEGCDKVCKSEKQLYNHKRHHHGVLKRDEKIECPTCKESFSTSGNLQVHILNKHTLNEHQRPYICEVCGKGFSIQRNLKRHMFNHNKPHNCNECDKAFSTKHLLMKHTRISHQGHTPERPHQCDMCEKTFRLPSLLQIHKNYHTGTKPYQCDECEVAFHSRADRWRHKQGVHLGIKRKKVKNQDLKRHNCEVCNKTFTVPSLLKMHMNTHTGEKPYQCDMCGKAYASNANLFDHKKVVHRGFKKPPKNRNKSEQI